MPKTCVYVVEPERAANLSESFAVGHVMTLPSVSTIADSLAPPRTTPYTYEICRRYVDCVVRVADFDIRRAMVRTFLRLKLSVEPAGAVALAGALGPLAESLTGRRIGILVCGANIDLVSFSALATDE
jgi:threonine dehydratase